MLRFTLRDEVFFPRLILCFLLLLPLFLQGCATPSAKVTAQVTAPKSAQLWKVAVISEAAGDQQADPALLENVRAALRQQGFQLVDPTQADLIVLPLFLVTDDFTTQSPSYRFSRIALTRSGLAGGYRSGGDPFAAFDESPTRVAAAQRAGLMVTAVERQVWESLPEDASEVPRVWRVTAISEFSESGTRPTPDLLVQTAAPYFGRDTGGAIAARLPSVSR